MAAAALGIVVTAALWWAHFDFVGPAARIALHAAEGGPRVAMARDAYAYLYLPMIAAMILFSIGNEEILHQITDPAGGIAERIEGPAVPMLFGGLISTTPSTSCSSSVPCTPSPGPASALSWCWRWPCRSASSCRRWARSPSRPRSASGWLSWR